MLRQLDGESLFEADFSYGDDGLVANRNSSGLHVRTFRWIGNFANRGANVTAAALVELLPQSTCEALYTPIVVLTLAQAGLRRTGEYAITFANLLDSDGI